MANVVGGVLAAIVAAVVFALAGIYIQIVSDAPCSVFHDPAKKDGEHENLEYCTQIKTYMKVILIATHLLSFALFPFAMYVFWIRGRILEQMEAKDPFYCVLGFSFLMVAIAGEIGWHVSQHWFYQEEYFILNFMFYFFFMWGVACWAYGIELKDNPQRGRTATTDILDKLSGLADILLWLSPIIVTIVYAGSATLNHICPKGVPNLPSICGTLSPSKVPIYILMAIEFAVLSIRLYRLLQDWRVVFLPIFSVGVNLFFIFLLNANVTDPFKNPLYHTLHDLIGTELGVFIITLLVWIKTGEPEESKRRLLTDD